MKPLNQCANLKHILQVTPQTPVDAAARCLKESGAGVLAVVQNGRVTNLVAPREIQAAAACGASRTVGSLDPQPVDRIIWQIAS